MNCTEIHEGLPQKEVRDFLSLQMVLTFEAEFDNKKEIHNLIDFKDSLEWAKQDARNQINFFKQIIINIETKQAICKLIENNGWEEFDVSDDVSNNSNYRLSMSFIGTGVEHIKLLNKVYPNKQ